MPYPHPRCSLSSATRERAKFEYVTGQIPNILELAKKYGISDTTAWRWFREDHWDKALRDHWANKWRQVSEVDHRYIQLSQAVTTVVARRVALLLSRDGKPIEPSSSTTNELQKLAWIIGHLHAVERVATGLESPRGGQVKVTVDLARLLQERADRPIDLQALKVMVTMGGKSDVEDDGPPGIKQVAPDPGEALDPLRLALLTGKRNGNGTAVPNMDQGAAPALPAPPSVDELPSPRPEQPSTTEDSEKRPPGPFPEEPTKQAG